MFNGRIRKKPLKVKIDLTEGSIIKKLLIVAVPMLLTSIVQMAYNLTDIFWVSRVDRIGLIKEEAVAAVGTAGFYAWFGFGLILIVKVGVSVRVSQAAGRNDQDGVNRFATNGLIVMALLAMLYSIFGIFFGRIFFDLFNINQESVVTSGVNYLRIVSMAGMAYFLVNMFNGVYDGLGKTINTFYMTVSGLILNMILDPIFILVLGFGVVGAASATAISQTFVLVSYLVLYMTKKRPAVLSFKKYFSFNTIGNIVKLGIPVGVQSMLMTTFSIVLGIMVASYGPTIMSVSRIGSQIEALSWMIASGFQVALASFVGQNVGANQFNRVKQGYFTSMKLLVPYGLAVNALLLFAAYPLFALFIPDEPTLSQGANYLRILSVSQLFMILEMVTAGALNGFGKTYVVSFIQMFGNALRIPLAIGLSILLTPSINGIWWALSISSLFKGTAIVILFAVFLTRHTKRLKHASVEKSYSV
ncbi:MAG: MATE family efflux transporter [Candidatus Izemoplasmataceae bacterium]|uniref:MATE family efflux transporter n=1 Tax=Liberiplasma polymorphum TaxID=3374570 RepID=UPI0037756F17